MQGDSVEVLSKLDGPFDFAYIDGDHEAPCVVADFALTQQLMRPGALVCFDDYEWSDSGTKRPPRIGIDAILRAFDVELVHKAYQVWVRIK
jgi:predicted O-methyltransferase YrrM